MLMYGWMKFVEVAPERYDWAVKFMTGGRLDKIKDQIAEEIRPGDNVLDIGCGTGTLAVRCLKKGATVTGLDSSEFMLKQSEKNAAAANLGDRLTVIQDSVTQLRKHFADESFDVVTSTMALGEFPREYLDYILQDCKRLLRPGGRLLIADEVWPEKTVPRLVYQAGMVLFWIPQFLLLRRALFPISDLRGIIRSAGFDVQRVVTSAASAFQLVFAEKKAAEKGVEREFQQQQQQVLAEPTFSV
ncbi:MAG TPA: corrinoid protein-associated methyltransferase CpaM [Pyrinomonadaceae bacterium]